MSVEEFEDLRVTMKRSDEGGCGVIHLLNVDTSPVFQQQLGDPDVVVKRGKVQRVRCGGACKGCIDSTRIRIGLANRK